MVIVLNGKETEVADKLTVLGLLEAKELGAGNVVVELNKTIIPVESFGEAKLNDGDHLEVLRFVGGG